MANFEKFILTSEHDGLALSVMYAEPVGVAVKGVVQIVHGMSEYKERYVALMEYLAENGFASVIHDHRGHGASLRLAEDLGYMYEAGVKGFLADVAAVNDWAKNKYKDLPMIMIGHSMGSLGARCFLKEYGAVMDLLILSGSPMKNDAVGVAKALAKMLKAFGRGKKKSKFLEALVFGPYAAAFRKEKSRFAWICKAIDVVRNYEVDPMCGFTFTADGFEVLFDLLYRTYENKKHPYKEVKKSLPILFISGEEDPCIGGEKNFKAAMASMREAGFESVSGKMYETLRHEIFNEEEKYEVFQDVLNFIEDNV